MSNSNSVVTRVTAWMLGIAGVVFFGGWALTQLVSGINWEMGAIVFAAIWFSLAGGFGAYVGLEVAGDI